ncbi:hypothetical protein CRUP_025540 [Coryphaenoides rupestris]|nr:hypothetical protein CRUP_025540 [Coryphaenoides rupestris]
MLMMESRSVACLLQPGSVPVLVARTRLLLQQLKQELEESRPAAQRLLVHCVGSRPGHRRGPAGDGGRGQAGGVLHMDHLLVINHAGLRRTSDHRFAPRPWRTTTTSTSSTTIIMEAVAVFDSPGKGRGLKATKELWAGDVVFSEPSLAAVVFDRLVLSLSWQIASATAVFRSQAKLQRCGQCKFAHYCDRTCQRAGWAEHKDECGAIKTYRKAPNESVRLAAHIMWRLDKAGGVVSDTQLTTVDELENHVPDMPEDDLKDLKVDIHNFLDFWPRYSKQHTVDDISHIFGVVNCNGFTVSDQKGLQAVGVGLFPNLCLVNHDCWPNCTVVLNHGKLD